MDTEKYLSALADKLRALGVSEEDISKQLKITRNYLESLDDAELSDTLSDTEQLDNVAENIYTFIQKKKEKLVETQELNKVLAETIPSVSERRKATYVCFFRSLSGITSHLSVWVW